VRQRRVLIAHQSTIPHYRVAFYRALQRIKPDWWSFAVVIDPDPERARRVFGEAVAAETLDFPLEPTATWGLPLSPRIRFQPFLRRARAFDLVIVEDAFNNLAYPMARLLLPRRVRIAYWGHGRDLHTLDPGPAKRLVERYKLRRARAADGFFAYTASVRDFLLDSGVDAQRVFAVGNTVDVLEHRRHFEALRGARDALREGLGAADSRLLLYVGRVNASKRLDLLSAAVRDLRERDARYRLIVAGGGDPTLLERLRRELGPGGFDYRGALVEPSELAPLFVAADAFVLPGLLGLAPLTALCYDLTPVVIENPAHGPEVEYFDSRNAVIAPAATDATAYADEIHRLLDDRERWLRLRAAAWPSIRHLTIDAMARNFVAGINTILGGLGPGAA
jgi:glycosyltransferase involved in cell wall biosynthesis